MSSLGELDVARQRVWAEIRRLGLTENVAELDMHGLTVVPPEKTGATPELVERLRRGCLDVIEERDGRPADWDGGTTHTDANLKNYSYALFDDRVFEEILMNEAALTLVSYLLGESAVLNAGFIFAKGPIQVAPGSRFQLDIHEDNLGNPGPFQHFAEYCNVTWLLTDYTLENGAIGYVPGSHLLRRHPLPGEGTEEAIPVVAPAGSIVCFHGSTWHCSFPRRNRGLRLSYAQSFARSYIQQHSPFGEDVTPEILARNPRRFRTLMGLDRIQGYRKEGPSYSRLLTDDGRMNSNLFWPTLFS